MNPVKPIGEDDMPRDAELSRLYRDAVAGEPPAALDRLIVGAAQREAARQPRRRSGAGWRRWFAPVSLAAVVVLTVTLTLLVHEERERDEAKPMAAPAAPAAPTADSVKPEIRDERSVAPALPPPPAAPAPQPERKRAVPPAAVPLQKASPEPFPGGAAEESMSQREARSADSAAQRDAAQPQVPLAAPAEPSATMRAAPKEAKPQPAPAPDTAAGAGPAAPLRESIGRAEKSAQTPAAWLEEIRELKRQGREREAQEALVQFRRAYPAYALPQDLR